RIGQAVTLIVNGLEYRSVGFTQLIHAFQSVEQLTMGIPGAAEEGGDRTEVHILGQGLLPLADDRLEGEAMAAAIPEQFSHFDLVRLLRRSHGWQLDIMHAGPVLGFLSLNHRQAAQQPYQSNSQQLAHVSLRTLFQTMFCVIQAIMMAKRFPGWSCCWPPEFSTVAKKGG